MISRLISVARASSRSARSASSIAHCSLACAWSLASFSASAASDALVASVSARSFSLSAHIMPMLVPTTPSASAAATTPPAITCPRLRFTNFASLYFALGGPANTGSSDKCLPMSAASPLAVSYRLVRSFSRHFITIQSRSPRSSRFELA